MAVEPADSYICYDLESKTPLYNHSMLVGKKCAYCMNCGQILMEYEDKEIIYKLMNPDLSPED